MNLKTIILIVLLLVAGVIFSSYFIGAYLTTQVLTPFSSLQDEQPEGLPTTPTIVELPEGEFSFIDADLQLGWIPWIIKQVSILIGGLSLVVFVYAGVSLIVFGDSEEQLGKSTKMIVFGVVGIGLAAFSYSIVANLLNIFT